MNEANSASSQKPVRLMVGTPAYGDQITMQAHMGRVYCTQAPEFEVSLPVAQSSILTLNHNMLLCQALNSEVDFLVILHADIGPQELNWLVRMYESMQRHKADTLSVVVPIQNQTGLTSTAVDTDLWRPRRLTMREIWSLPSTVECRGQIVHERWSAPLLFNTGCLMIRIGDVLRQAVKEGMAFAVRDRIVQDETDHFHPQVAPEDWEFSRQCHQWGLRSFVTREISLTHRGYAIFPNDRPFGLADEAEVENSGVRSKRSKPDQQNGRLPTRELGRPKNGQEMSGAPEPAPVEKSGP